MTSEFLSPGRSGDLALLTGARQRAKQIAVLSRNGIPFYVRADGWPVVAKAELSKPSNVLTKDST